MNEVQELTTDELTHANTVLKEIVEELIAEGNRSVAVLIVGLMEEITKELFIRAVGPDIGTYLWRKMYTH